MDSMVILAIWKSLVRDTMALIDASASKNIIFKLSEMLLLSLMVALCTRCSSPLCFYNPYFIHCKMQCVTVICTLWWRLQRALCNVDCNVHCVIRNAMFALWHRECKLYCDVYLLIWTPMCIVLNMMTNVHFIILGENCTMQHAPKCALSWI